MSNLKCERGNVFDKLDKESKGNSLSQHDAFQNGRQQLSSNSIKR